MGRNFDILPWDEPGRDFDSLSRLFLQYPRTAMGQTEKKSKKIRILGKKKNLKIFDFIRLYLMFFVPGQKDSGTRKLFLSLDKGTAGQGNFFVPGCTVGCPVPWTP